MDLSKMVYDKAYYDAHKEQFKTYRRRWYDKNKLRFREYSKIWRQRHPEELVEVLNRFENKHTDPEDSHSRAARNRKSSLKAKTDVIAYYSLGTMKCARCGFDDIRALSIDHLKGDGFAHRREINRKGGREFYIWLRQNNFPPGFQVLCMNCQWLKRAENHEHDNVRRKRLSVAVQIEKNGGFLIGSGA